LAAQTPHQVVLNQATPERLAHHREKVNADAAAVDREPPRLTVWVPAALRPGEAAVRQAAGQLAVYLGPPGYGEMFARLGYADLVDKARAGVRRAELAAAIPLGLLEQVGAFGDRKEVTARLQAYLSAGADTVAVVPVTAEDPAGQTVLDCAAATNRQLSTIQEPSQ
jgi:alkanesulfonate monooxygenase SsuD/methylene tetrahydromethanopterin reductase-like flavin-dependent oxidoreductase (luciferase family)